MPRLLLIILVFALAACQRPTVHLPHEAYVWQRQWTPAVVEALAQPARVSALRVLALEVDGAVMHRTAPDLPALASDGRPVWLVVRIEGSRLPLAAEALAPVLGEIAGHWKQSGVRLAGIEIDHDTASAALADYARWLRELRPLLPKGLPVSVTALPTWMDHAALAEVLAAVEGSVLQVHAIAHPREGLFDAGRAEDWVRRYGSLAPHDFRVALPAYGVRVATSGERVTAVDAEAVVPTTGPAGVELRADPERVADLLAELDGDRPEGLAGYLWFRLPVAGDRRSWSARTLAAVIAAEPLRARFVLEVTPSDGGAVDLALVNRGNLDAAPPALSLPADCTAGDAIGHYHRVSPTPIRLDPISGARLPAGARMAVGWARCAQPLAAAPGVEVEWRSR
jgi:hypothetical protein